MGYVPAAGIGGGWGPSGVFTQKFGFRRSSLEYAQAKSQYHSLRYQYAGRSPVDAFKIGFWKSAQVGQSPRYWKEYQKLANYAFPGLPGRAKMAKLKPGVRILTGSAAGKRFKSIVGSSKTQKQLERGMALKKGLDKRIIKTNPIRRTQYYKGSNRIQRASLDGAYLTLVYGAGRAAWTGGGSAFTARVLGMGKRFIRKRRFS